MIVKYFNHIVKSNVIFTFDVQLKCILYILYITDLEFILNIVCLMLSCKFCHYVLQVHPK